MSNKDYEVSAVSVPTFATADLSEAVELVRDTLAGKAAARDTNAATHLRKLIEILRKVGA